MVNKGILLLSGALLLACLPPGFAARAAQQTDAGAQKKAPAFRGAAVRYQVTDVARSFAFYTQRLGFTGIGPKSPAFAAVTSGSLTLYLSGPGSSGARPLPGGIPQKPGGSNRIVVEVDDLPAVIAALKKADVRFRNEMETGPGGRQVQVEDPDGNPVELFERAP